MKYCLEMTFKKKRVLVTGHTGFKGSWLSIWLLELGAHVIGYALDPYTENDNFVRSGLSSKMVDIRGDVRDIEKLKNTFRQYKPEIVFHLAAQPLVRESYRIPKDTFDTNIGGTVNLLECCRHSDSVRTIINITSDKCYENIETTRGYAEDDRMGGHDPYSASKGCSELVTRAYRHSFFNPENLREHGKSLSSVRAGNVIGGGDWAKDRIIPDCIRCLEREKKIQIRSPLATRPWQFVLEPLGGYMLLASKMTEHPEEYSDAWNFGPEIDSVVNVQKIVELVIKHWGGGEWYMDNTEKGPHEAGLLFLNIDKAKKALNWYPKYTVDNAVAETVDWYRKNRTENNMYKFCVQQIHHYMEKEA